MDKFNVVAFLHSGSIDLVESPCCECTGAVSILLGVSEAIGLVTRFLSLRLRVLFARITDVAVQGELHSLLRYMFVIPTAVVQCQQVGSHIGCCNFHKLGQGDPRLQSWEELPVHILSIK